MSSVLTATTGTGIADPTTGEQALPATPGPPGPLGTAHEPGCGGREARRWLARQAGPGRRFFLAAALMDGVSAAGTAVLSWYAAGLITAGVADGVAGPGSHRLAGDVFGVVAGGVSRAVASFVADRLAAAGGARVEAVVRDTVLNALIEDGPADAPVSTGSAVAAVSDQLPRLGAHFHDYQRRAVAAVAVPVVILVAVFPASWVVGLLLVLATPIIPLNMAATGLGAEAVGRRQLQQVTALSSQVLERLQAMSTLRALGAIGHQRRVVEQAAGELARRSMLVLRVAFLASTALEWISTFAIGMVAMYVGATLLGYMRVPLLPSHLGAQAGVFVLLLTPAHFAPLRRFAAAYHQRQESIAAAEILEPLCRPADPRPVRFGAEDSAVPAPATPVGRRTMTVTDGTPSVVVRAVTVHFPGRTSPALADVSLRIPPRGVVGVTGASGSGKSTLLKVAGGWLAPGEGEALIDGVSASGTGRGLLIGQRPYLFSGSLADNIALADPGASRGRILAAVEAAQLTGLLDRLPDGLDSVLGERGQSISGGEAQRVALARAFLSDAPFVLLDEPTAHLDAATETALLDPLARLLTGRTALIAAHSDAVLRLADYVITLEEGRIRG